MPKSRDICRDPVRSDLLLGGEQVGRAGTRLCAKLYFELIFELGIPRNRRL